MFVIKVYCVFTLTKWFPLFFSSIRKLVICSLRFVVGSFRSTDFYDLMINADILTNYDNYKNLRATNLL